MNDSGSGRGVAGFKYHTILWMTPMARCLTSWRRMVDAMEEADRRVLFVLRMPRLPLKAREEPTNLLEEVIHPHSCSASRALGQSAKANGPIPEVFGVRHQPRSQTAGGVALIQVNEPSPWTIADCA
jgi:hypothetical protein